MQGVIDQLAKIDIMNAFEIIYEVVSKIPKGKVATYGDIADAAGIPGGARAVGNAMANNSDTKRVPCHRVVQSTGYIGGYMGGRERSNLKVKKLIAEGIDINRKTGKIRNLSKFRYVSFKA